MTLMSSAQSDDSHGLPSSQQTIHLRRSVLFMPATNQRAVAKATQLPVDAVILDLEDSVLPAQKSNARDDLARALKSHQFGYREVLVRINGLDTDWWQDDLQMVMSGDAQGVVVPKVESPEQVHAVVSVMRAAAEAGESQLKPLWIMLETPAGVLASAEICQSDPNLVAVLIGTADLGKELHLPYRPDRLGLMTSLGQVVLAARRAGLSVIDGVYMDTRNADGLEAECKQGLALGFDGKSLIHPAQLEAANRVFTPDKQEIEQSRQIVEAWQQSQSSGSGVCVVNNRLVEHLHVRRAQEVIAMAQLIEQRSTGVA